MAVVGLLVVIVGAMRLVVKLEVVKLEMGAVALVVCGFSRPTRQCRRGCGGPMCYAPGR